MTHPATIPFELESMASAQNYQKWISDLIAPHLGQSIFEVGAGIGNMSRWLPVRESLILNEIDPHLRGILTKSLGERTQNPRIKVIDYDLFAPKANSELSGIDTIVSFNVLEHIQEDEKFLRAMGALLNASGARGPKTLVTLVPSHHWAYGSMDREFGHFRRYGKKQLLELHQKAMPNAKTTLQHLNFVGLLGWFVRGRILRKREISLGVIQTFEKLTPTLRKIDTLAYRLLRLGLGQSLLAVSKQ